jgi:DNA polymerase
MSVIFRDVETRSVLNLAKVGAWRYAGDPSTEVLCLAYAVDDAPVRVWTPGQPIPEEFNIASADPAWLIVAHNDQFESAIEERILIPRHGWPIVPIERHRCTMAMALAAALPGALDSAAAALGFALRKDADGARLMRAMARPRKTRPDEDPAAAHWHDDPERRARLHEYCARDVALERELFRRLPLLSDAEQALWALDATINRRGFPVDIKLAEAAQKIVVNAQKAIDAEVAELTDGVITSIGQVGRVQKYLEDHGHSVKGVTKRSVSAVLAHGPGETVARLLRLRQEGGKASANKLGTLIAMQNAGRLQGTMKFHGAATGRWSGAGFQPHNLARDQPTDSDATISAVLSGDLEKVRAIGPPLEVIGSLSRSLICAAPGKVLIGADFSAVESRVLAWLAGEEWKLDVYRRFDTTGDPAIEPYCVTASRVLRRTVTPDHEEDRQLGKFTDLAFGFGGALGAFRRIAPDADFTDAEVETFKQQWRASHPKIITYWGHLHRALLSAVRTGTPATFKNLRAAMRAGNLHLFLPGGRALTYPEARIVPGQFSDEIEFKDNVRGGWLAQRGWHGSFVENVVQAISRDLLANAMPKLEAAGYPIVLHVHDEIVSEVPEGFGDPDEFARLMTVLPEWAAGLPLIAKASRRQRYAKAKNGAADSAVPSISPNAVKSTETAAANPPESRSVEANPTPENAPLDAQPASEPMPPARDKEDAAASESDSAGDETCEFLAAMFDGYEGAIYLSSLANSADKHLEGPEEHALTRDPAAVRAFLRRDRPRRAVYFCVSTVRPGSATRSTETLAELCGLHVDVDLKDVTVGLPEIDEALRRVALPPTAVVASGRGLHAYWRFRRGIPTTRENVERVKALLRLLADHLGGDLSCAEPARLMRLPGSHNTKDGAWIPVRVVRSTPVRYEIDELEAWLERTDAPLLSRKPSGKNDYSSESAGPTDVDARLAAMTHRGGNGTSVHETQLSVSAALLNRGFQVDLVTEILVHETRRAAGADGAGWDWRREERDIRGMCATWLRKNPELAADATAPLIVTAPPIAATVANEGMPDAGSDDGAFAETAAPKTAGTQADGGSEYERMMAGGARAQKNEEEQEAKAPPLVFIDMSRWDDEPTPEQEWIVYNRIPRRECVLFSGEGGAGKSIEQLHLSAAAVLKLDWLGTTPEQGPAIFIDAEDDVKVLHRRTKAIAAHYGATITEMIKGGLHLVSWRGCDAALAVARNGKIEPTPLYKRLLEAAGDIKPTIIGIAASANVFAGNENDRAQVQQFIGLLTRVAMVADGSVVLISHPSLAGINTETGLSGTTQWHNSVRARYFMRGVKPEAGEPLDTDLREIVFKKNNYGSISESIVLRWSNGLFLPVSGAPADQAAKEAIAQEVFLEMLLRLRAQNRYVSDKPSANYAPATFAKEQETRRAGLTKNDLARAMRLLFQRNVIWNEPVDDKPSRRASYRIAPKT